MSAFERRGIELVVSDLTYEGWIDDMAAAGLNLLILHTPDDVPGLVRYAVSPQSSALLRRATAAGIDVEWGPHAMRHLLPRQCFAEHPEWFRMDKVGRRVADWNLCPSSEEALDTVSRRAAELAHHLVPTTHRYYFWADDGQPWCHCADCASLDPADQSLLVSNAILARLRRQDPEATASALAYLTTLDPPRRVRPAQGSFLEYAAIGRCLRHALDDPDCAVNRRELATLTRVLPAYAPLRGAQLVDYWLDESWYWRAAGRPAQLPLLPFSPEVLAQDLRLYARLGFRSVVTYAVMLGAEYRSLHGEPPLRQYGQALLATE